MKRLALSILCLVVANAWISDMVAAAAARSKVTLRLAIADNKTPAEVLEQLLAPFEQMYPHIDLEITALYGNNLDKLTVEKIGGSAADIFITYNEATVLSMANGFNLDLMPYIRKDAWDAQLRDFLPATLNLMRQGGGLYGLPQYQAVGGVYYNRTMFDESGLTYPDGKWDWNEFVRVLQRLTRTDGGKVTVSGFTQPPGWLWFFPWLEQNGVSFDNPAVVPLSDPKAIEAIQFVKDLQDRGYLQWTGSDPFLRKASAMIHSGAWELKYWVNSGVTMGVTAPPKGPVKSGTLANTDIIAINRDTKYPEEAWLFLKWFYTPDVQQKYLQAFGLMPARISLIPSWIESVRQLYRNNNAPAVEGLQVFITNSAMARPQPFFADPRVIREDINPALGQIFAQGAPIRATLEAMSQVATNKLQQAAQAR